VAWESTAEPSTAAMTWSGPTWTTRADAQPYIKHHRNIFHRADFIREESIFLHFNDLKRLSMKFFPEQRRGTLARSGPLKAALRA